MFPTGGKVSLPEVGTLLSQVRETCSPETGKEQGIIKQYVSF
jgi:hypothetical protein